MDETDALLLLLEAEKERALPQRSSRASDKELDHAMTVVGARDPVQLRALARTVVDRWSLTSELSDRVITHCQR